MGEVNREGSLACIGGVDALQVDLVAVLVVFKSVQAATGALLQQELTQI